MFEGCSVLSVKKFKKLQVKRDVIYIQSAGLRWNIFANICRSHKYLKYRILVIENEIKLQINFCLSQT